MFNIEKLIEKIERKSSAHRWNGGGQGAIAVLCGFRRPLDNDPGGMWVHPQAGSYRDDRMPTVVDMILCRYLAHMGEADIACSLSNFKKYLVIYQGRILLALQMDHSSPPQLWEQTEVILGMIEKQIQIIDALTFE